MRKFVSILSLGALWPVGASWAQAAKNNEMGVTMGHIHVIGPERQKETKSWLTLGGQLGNNISGDNESVYFPGIVILLGNGKNVGGSEGSVVDHLGFRVPNLDASVAKWRATNWGMKEKKTDTKPGQAFWVTASGVKLEILEDKSLKVPIVFDHIHFYVQDAVLQAEEDYYTKLYGAKPVSGHPDTFSLPGGKLVFTKSATPTVSPTGRSLDHIGFEIAGSDKGLEAFSKRLEADSGVKWQSKYHKSNVGNARPLDPAGVMTELTHGLGGYADYKAIEPGILACENRTATCW